MQGHSFFLSMVIIPCILPSLCPTHTKVLWDVKHLMFALQAARGKYFSTVGTCSSKAYVKTAPECQADEHNYSHKCLSCFMNVLRKNFGGRLKNNVRKHTNTHTHTQRKMPEEKKKKTWALCPTFSLTTSRKSGRIRLSVAGQMCDSQACRVFIFKHTHSTFSHCSWQI